VAFGQPSDCNRAHRPPLTARTGNPSRLGVETWLASDSEHVLSWVTIHSSSVPAMGHNRKESPMTSVLPTTTPASRARIRHLASATLLAAGLALGVSALGQAAIAVAQPIDPHFDPGRDPELSCVAGGGTWDITESDEIGTGEGGGACVGGGEEDPLPPVPPVPPKPPTGDPKPPTTPTLSPWRVLPVTVAR
jgi:hypothetical protein